MSSLQEESGIISFKAEEGDVVQVGQVVCTIDTSAEKPEGLPEVSEKSKPRTSVSYDDSSATPIENKNTYATGHPSPAASKMMTEKGLDAQDITGTGKDGRITKSDVINTLSSGHSGFEPEEKKHLEKRCPC